MRRLLPAFIALALFGAACSSDDTSSDDTSAAPATDETPSTEAPSTEPPATDPPATEPPDTEPAVTEAPATDPPATDPPATDPPATEAPAAELAPFTPIGDGPYAVGVQTITITDAERDRPLTVDVWFPLAEGTTGDPYRYTFITGDYYESPRAIGADPASISPDGPFPLVVYTHGSGGLRYIHSDYTETLASHGYLVVAADHTGNTTVDQFLGTEDDRATIAYNRPRDVQVLIDEFLNPESLETVGFVASADPEQIAVTGHSLGGYATYAVASGMENEAGTLAPDPRIGALIPLAPALGDGNPETSLLVDERLAAVDVPTLVMVGTDDASTPPSPNVDRAFELATSSTLYRVDLVAAEHQSFTDVCDYLEFFPTLENPTEAVIETVEDFAEAGCSEGDMPIDRVKEITNTFAVSFLDSVFDGTEMITADTTEIPDDVIFAQR
ncbi:MAG: chlorophyllase/cutinase-like alpha/beta fold protein [Ilumatobacter sp.]|uniref:alpha/beta hydrolase n=1 Tax=Ilumatobacter sp. TaxID=1967498 RepID=UPI00391D9842